MHFHVFPHATYCALRQAAVCLRGWRWRQLEKGVDRVQAGAGMQFAVGWTARNFGWSHKRAAPVVAAGDQQSRMDISPVLAPKQVSVSFEDSPQADAGPQPAVIEHEGHACDLVCADDALVAVNCQQHAHSAALGRRHRDDPLSTELLSKESFFYG